MPSRIGATEPPALIDPYPGARNRQSRSRIAECPPDVALDRARCGFHLRALHILEVPLRLGGHHRFKLSTRGKSHAEIEHRVHVRLGLKNCRSEDGSPDISSRRTRRLENGIAGGRILYREFAG